MKKKLAVWISQKHVVPYRLRKSFVKRTFPSILSDYQFEIDFYGLKYSGNTKDTTDRLFFMFGGCEKYMLSFMRDYVKALNKNDCVFVDVGAHVGNHSLFMSRYVKRVHAFEPNPMVRDKLDSHIYLNNVDNITVHPIGLSNVNEVIPFYHLEGEHISYGSFLKSHDPRNTSTLDLKVRVGDEIFADKKINHVDIIKLDVEGYERPAIEGLKRTIDKSRPLIIAEISSTTRLSFGSKDDFESIFPKNYCFYQFSGVSREREKYMLAPFDYAKHKNHLDVIAVPKEKRSYLLDKVTSKLKKCKISGGNL